MELNITDHVGTPLIRSLSVYYVDHFIPYKKERMRIWSETTEVKEFTKDMFDSGKAKMEVNLSDLITLPGQYIVNVIPSDSSVKIKLADARVYYDGTKALQEFVTISGQSINVNRTSTVTSQCSSVLIFAIESETPCNGKITFNSAFVY